MICKRTASDQPRIILGRHDHGCEDDTCTGCQPCVEAHCRVCSATHVDGACAECVGAVRKDLDDIVRLNSDLPNEVEHRGVNGEAFVLLAGNPDPEARGHLEASVAAGRVPQDYLGEQLVDKNGKPLTELAPLWVLGSWSMVYRDAFEHDEPMSLASVESEAGYLTRNLTYMASYEWVPFEELAAALRKCRSRLEGVLHDQERGVRANVGCFDCGSELERRLGAAGFDDAWTCWGCRRRYTIAEYNFALRAKLEKSALEASA